MAENLYSPSSQTSKTGMNDFYILAHAARKDDHKILGSINLALSSKTLKSQNDLRSQNRDVPRNSNILTSSQSKIRLPLNRIIVSKPVTRKPLPENNASMFDGIDLSDIRNSKLLSPPWKEKKANRKSLQSAYLHNKRKIEEIQGMKAKMKLSQYRPGVFLPKQRQEVDTAFQKKQQSTSLLERFPQLYDGCRTIPQSKPLVMKSENPFPDDESDDEQTEFEEMANENENFVLSSDPITHTTQNKFVWNPIIIPNSKSFSSAIDLLKSNCSPLFDRKNSNKWFDSPGNLTTSSSSGLTVAEEEETVKFTYFAGRSRVPLNEQSQLRRDETHRYMYDPRESFVQDWRPHSRQSGSYNYYEE